MDTQNPERHALVIGAGLAGAALCAALARRGWRLTLLDAASGPGQGASALPVGMLSPHVTRAPTPLSRLSELGVPDMRAQLEGRIQQGAGWQDCEVDNLGHAPGRWPAALVRPAALVCSWLEEAQETTRLQTLWCARVTRLVWRNDPAAGARWQALDADGSLLAQAPYAVVAAAYGSHALLNVSAGQDSLSLPLRPVQGQLSFGALDGEALAERPQRDNGVFVPHYEDSGLAPRWPARVWAMGSTYERGSESTDVCRAAHERNAKSLDQLCPSAARVFRNALASDQVLGWAQVRCASLDRLPLMGAVPDLAALADMARDAGARRGRIPLAAVPRWPGLYTLTALGSRGLTLSHWCATQLALMMDGQPCEVPSSDQDLIAALDPARFAWKQARRQPTPQPVTPL